MADLSKTYDYAILSPIEELAFILDAAKMNKEAVESSREGRFGHDVSKKIEGEKGRYLFGDNLHSQMLVSTTGACDARMAGAMVPVMSNSGSGNQGIAATLPVLTYAENTGCTEEQLIRALVISNLSMIYIKQYIGRLSPLCGCVIASYRGELRYHLPDGRHLQQSNLCRKNMVANITGMIARGQAQLRVKDRKRCLLRQPCPRLMAIETRRSPTRGIVDERYRKTIENLD